MFIIGGRGESPSGTYISKQVALLVQNDERFKPAHETVDKKAQLVVADETATSLPAYIVTGASGDLNRKLHLPESEKKPALDLASDISIFESKVGKFRLKGGLLKNEGPSGVSLTCVKWTLFKIEW